MRCGYDKHYEVCYIKDLKDFSRDETFYEINHKSNLIHLCCNCHWEFDKGLIDINTIKEAQLRTYSSLCNSILSFFFCKTIYRRR